MTKYTFKVLRNKLYLIAILLLISPSTINANAESNSIPAESINIETLAFVTKSNNFKMMYNFVVEYKDLSISKVTDKQTGKEYLISYEDITTDEIKNEVNIIVNDRENKYKKTEIKEENIEGKSNAIIFMLLVIVAMCITLKWFL